MPLLAILLLALMIALFGFGDTVEAILGGIGFLILLIVVGAALVAAAAAALFRRGRRDVRRR